LFVNYLQSNSYFDLWSFFLSTACCTSNYNSLSRGHVYHLFVVRVKEREAFRQKLYKNGVDTLIHYPKPIPCHKAYREYKDSLKELTSTVRLSREIVSLPIYPEMETREAVGLQKGGEWLITGSYFF